MKTTTDILTLAEKQGFELVPAAENWYLIWEKDEKQFGAFIPNVPDYHTYAAKEIEPYLNE
jgi:hypothetical protein